MNHGNILCFLLIYANTNNNVAKENNCQFGTLSLMVINRQLEDFTSVFLVEDL